MNPRFLNAAFTFFGVSPSSKPTFGPWSLMLLERGFSAFHADPGTAYFDHSITVPLSVLDVISLSYLAFGEDIPDYVGLVTLGEALKELQRRHPDGISDRMVAVAEQLFGSALPDQLIRLDVIAQIAMVEPGSGIGAFDLEGASQPAYQDLGDCSSHMVFRGQRFQWSLDTGRCCKLSEDVEAALASPEGVELAASILRSHVAELLAGVQSTEQRALVSSLIAKDLIA